MQQEWVQHTGELIFLLPGPNEKQAGLSIHCSFASRGH